MLNYQAQMKLRLEEALKWFQENRKPNQVAKLEARLVYSTHFLYIPLFTISSFFPEQVWKEGVVLPPKKSSYC